MYVESGSWSQLRQPTYPKTAVRVVMNNAKSQGAEYVVIRRKFEAKK